MSEITMSRSEALVLAQKARQAFWDKVGDAFGYPIEVGKLNGDGLVITQERYESMCRQIDEASMGIIEGAFEIIEDPS